jgi:hypothetical protein
MIQGMREPIEFRQPAPVRIYFVCFALLWVGSLVAFGIRSPSDALITVLVSAIGVAFIIRIWSVKFVADESGLVVRNFFRTLRLGWGEVEDFRLGTMMGMPFGRVIHVLLRNGEVVTLDITASHWTLSSVEGRSRSRCCRDCVSGSLARASPIPFIGVVSGRTCDPRVVVPNRKGATVRRSTSTVGRPRTFS